MIDFDTHCCIDMIRERSSNINLVFNLYTIFYLQSLFVKPLSVSKDAYFLNAIVKTTRCYAMVKRYKVSQARNHFIFITNNNCFLKLISVTMV
jgi:hypothetical protein